jgi:hypothetical protein
MPKREWQGVLWLAGVVEGKIRPTQHSNLKGCVIERVVSLFTEREVSANRLLCRREEHSCSSVHYARLQASHQWK